jgi:hypothetical protein
MLFDSVGHDPVGGQVGQRGEGPSIRAVQTNTPDPSRRSESNIAGEARLSSSIAASALAASMPRPTRRHCALGE